MYDLFDGLSTRVYDKMEESLPGFDKVAKKVQQDLYTRLKKLKQKKDEEERKAREKEGLFEDEWPKFP